MRTLLAKIFDERLPLIVASFALAFFAGLFLNASFAAWDPPSATPPSGNIIVPINEGGTAQTKTGSLRSSTDVRAPIFYATNNTSYYVNPFGTSVMQMITGLAAPVNPSDVANKAYVDAAAGGGGGGGYGQSVMYLRASVGDVPAACPAGWSEADYGGERTDIGVVASALQYAQNITRTCYISTPHQVLYLSESGTTVPAACPAGWSQADYRAQRTGIVEYAGGPNYSFNTVRTCYRAVAGGGGSMTILEKKCAWSDPARGPGSCAPASCNAGWTNVGTGCTATDIAGAGGGQSGIAQPVGAVGFCSQYCAQGGITVAAKRCAWSDPTRGPGSCTPASCNGGWTDLGIGCAATGIAGAGGGQSSTPQPVGAVGYCERYCIQ